MFMIANKIRVLEQWTVRKVVDTSVADLGTCVLLFCHLLFIAFSTTGVYYIFSLMLD